MPNYNYTVDVMTSNGKKNLISIVMIDTIKLCGNTFFSMNPFSKDDTSTPHFMSKEDQNLASMYLVNFENKLKAANSSGVPYIIVGGHFPVYSVAEHGSTQCLVQNVMPLLHKYKVSAYLSGHDHNLQHISYTNLGSTVEYIVAGANSWNANSMQNLNTVPNLSLKFRWPENTELVYGGFLLVEAGQFKMNVNFVKADGTFLYKKEILRRV
jgi:tartrate-resistant acid phosphatase type 5